MCPANVTHLRPSCWKAARRCRGCLSYVIAADPADSDALWITEVWDSQASHQGSHSLPAVQAAIAKGRPMIAGFSNRVDTVPIGGHGLPRAIAQTP